MRRREFITLIANALAPWSAVAAAQQHAMPLIGYLDSTTHDTTKPNIFAFWRGLNELGYFEGQNVAITYRFAENQNDRLPTLATELVQQGVDIIFGSAIRPTLAAKAATSDIPIVFACPCRKSNPSVLVV